MAHSLYEAHRLLFTLYQVTEETGQDHLERFNTTITMLDQIGVTGMGTDYYLTVPLLNGNSNASNPTVIDTAEVDSNERNYAMAFLRGADHVRYIKLLEELDKGFVKGIDSYPETLLGAYNLIKRCWKFKP